MENPTKLRHLRVDLLYLIVIAELYEVVDSAMR